VVAKGSLKSSGNEPAAQLDEGDAIDFLADVPHSYRTSRRAGRVYLVMSYDAEPFVDCDA